MRFSFLIAAVLVQACSPASEGDEPENARTGFEPPVATNPETPVIYPPTLFAEGIEGTVMLHLYIDETGTVIPDSTRIAESSGVPALDSAALQGASGFTFAPAYNDGVPVAAAFLQPVYFRHPAESSEGENS